MPLKVLFVSSEVAPFRKTGGLADVAGALPKALARRGIDVRVVMPLYQGMRWNEFERLDGAVEVPMYFGTARAGVRLTTLPGSQVPIYFLEHHQYYDRPFVYGPPGQGYSDNLERFVFLARASLELTKALGWVPDVAHANDWQTALVPVYLNTVEWGKPLHGTSSVFTVHNLAYQGNQGGGAHFITGLGWEHFNPSEFEHFGDFNPLKAALVHSSMLSTVSPTYAREIQTPEFGCGLDGVLAARSRDLRGILNGIDVDTWNPARDPHLPVRFDRDQLARKAACKAALQREMGLPERPEVPLFGVVSRLTPQKGLDILAFSLERLLAWDLQLVVLGSGDPEAERFFASMTARRGDKIRAFIGFDDGLSHRIEGGSDFFIMPSRFEPCGLNQMYSLRYGTLPLVRATGGLADTVQTYDEGTGQGTGFVFKDLTPDALANTVGWALSTYHDRPEHILQMRRRAMEQDFSWERAAAQYEQLYLDAYERRRKHPFAEPSAAKVSTPPATVRTRPEPGGSVPRSPTG
jgi:starch synthase